MLEDIEVIVRSDRVFDEIYDKDSDEVIEWTAFFSKRANIPEIFKDIENRIAHKKYIHAEVVGTFWHHFSALAPKVMSIASARVENNLMRHYIVQVIFEELGTRNHRFIHPDLFLDVIDKLGITQERRKELVSKYLTKLGFSNLCSLMWEAKNSSEILGILLGLEIDANENIQTIFNSLSYNTEAENYLELTPFFKIHRIAEDEHIRLDVANFLRFCKTEEDKDDFILGFDKAVFFWKNYWKAIVEIIDSECLV